MNSWKYKKYYKEENIWIRNMRYTQQIIIHRVRWVRGLATSVFFFTIQELLSLVYECLKHFLSLSLLCISVYSGIRLIVFDYIVKIQCTDAVVFYYNILMIANVQFEFIK